MAHAHRFLIGVVVAAVALTAALALIAAGGQASLAENDVIYVDFDAPGPTHDGSSWVFAYTDLQLALADAESGDQIWVAAGTYKPTSETDRTISFQMVNGVAVYGGFDPSGGDDAWEERDWATNVTILSGDIGDDATNADNSYHVFYHPSELALDGTAIMDGFTVTGGNANGTEPHSRGGGMVNDSSSPSLLNCTFSGNSASGSGAGMHNTNSSSPTLTDCTFQGNTAGTEGGGMHNDGSSPTLTGCTFSENTADAGGGIYNGDSLPELSNCTFAGNSANSGGGIHNDGSSPVLTNCTFKGNSAVGNGGGLRNTRSSSPTLTNCTFHGNRATNGGAIHNYLSSPPTVTNCILWGDAKPEIVNLESSAIVTYCDVEGGYPGEGNIDEDPLFADPDNGNFHLMPGSPCTDAGTDTAPHLPAQDFEGDLRILDGDGDGDAVVDMGVDEALWYPVYLPLVLRAYSEPKTSEISKISEVCVGSS